MRRTVTGTCSPSANYMSSEFLLFYFLNFCRLKEIRFSCTEKTVDTYNQIFSG